LATNPAVKNRRFHAIETAHWNASMSQAMQPDRFRYPITKRKREGCGDSRRGGHLNELMSLVWSPRPTAVSRDPRRLGRC
jgi:hypothetical protein